MQIVVQTLVRADLDTVWHTWNDPRDIMRWNAASDDWHTTQCHVDLRVGGTFSSRMEAKDGSAAFDFEGTYIRVVEKELIEYTLADGRAVRIDFADGENGVRVRETFDADSHHDGDVQRKGWQAILDNFAHYTEAKTAARFADTN